MLTSRGRVEKPAGALGVFDVFDAEGRFQHQVTVHADYDERYDEFLIRGDRLFVIKEANSGAGLTSESSTGHGMTMVVRRGGNAGAAEEEDAREPEPLGVLCYDLGG